MEKDERGEVKQWGSRLRASPRKGRLKLQEEARELQLSLSSRESSEVVKEGGY